MKHARIQKVTDVFVIETTRLQKRGTAVGGRGWGGTVVTGPGKEDRGASLLAPYVKGRGLRCVETEEREGRS